MRFVAYDYEHKERRVSINEFALKRESERENRYIISTQRYRHLNNAPIFFK
jgi:hypothetical protein